MARQNKDGLWHQVLDRPKSYTETSCSGMFTYSLLAGSNKGWLPSSSACCRSQRLGWPMDKVNG